MFGRQWSIDVGGNGVLTGETELLHHGAKQLGCWCTPMTCNPLHRGCWLDIIYTLW